MDEQELELQNENTESGLTLTTSWHEEDKDELLESTFNHSTETIRKDTRIDFLLTAIGIFALICFGVMLYQCIRFGSFGILNYICFVCYIVIAVLFIPKPMQCFFSHKSWKLSTSKFTAASKPEDVTFYDEKAEFKADKKDVSVSYKYMEAIFETENYFVLMVESKRILTFAKKDLTDEQKAGLTNILSAYLADNSAAAE